MPAKQLLRAIGWLPHVCAVCSAFVLALIFWPPKSNLQIWKPSTRITAGFTEMQPETLAWKQPILPAQYAQGNCGACHRADLPETPRLNHGRQLIVRLNCIGCHRLQDVDRPAMLGPDLTNVGTKVSREWIYKWLKEPRTITDADGNVTVDGVAMEARMPKAAKGLTISRRSNGSYRAQIRKVGFPYQSKDFLTLLDADAWGMARLAEMEAGNVFDRRSAKRMTFGATIDQYLAAVTERRPGEASRIAE